jgi:hypothetical protein
LDFLLEIHLKSIRAEDDNERNDPLDCEGARKAEHIEEASTIDDILGRGGEAQFESLGFMQLVQHLLGPLGL